GKCAYGVGRSRQARCARDATQTEDRDALHVRAQRHPVDQTRIDRWSREAGDGNEVQVVDVARGYVRAEQRLLQRAFAEIHGGGDPRVVPLGEGIELQVALDRQRQVSAADAHGSVELLQAIDVEVLLGPLRAERVEQRLLIDVVGRKSGRGGNDVRLAHALPPTGVPRAAA